MDQQKQWHQSQKSLHENSTNSTEDTNGGDWQEEVYQKIVRMKEMYLPELSEIYQKIANKLQTHESSVEFLLLRSNLDQHEKLKMFKNMLERLITVLNISKSSISPCVKEKLGFYEMQIKNYIKTCSPRKPVSSIHLPPSEMHNAHQLPQPKMKQQDQSALVLTEEQQWQPHPAQQKYASDIQSQLGHMQQRQFSLQQQKNPLHGGMQQRLQVSGQLSGAILQPTNTTELQNQTSSTSLGSPAKTGHTDWQEETYQKIKVMKNLYFAELSEMYWKIATKLQLDFHFQQQTSDQYKLILSKNRLEGLITVLHYTKTDIPLGLKEKLVFYEKQMVDFINANRLR